MSGQGIRSIQKVFLRTGIVPLAYFPCYRYRINNRINQHIKWNRIESSCLFKYTHKTDPNYFYIPMPLNEFFRICLSHWHFRHRKSAHENKYFWINAARQATAFLHSYIINIYNRSGFSLVKERNKYLFGLKITAGNGKKFNKRCTGSNTPIIHYLVSYVIFWDRRNSLNGQRIPGTLA